MRTRVLAAAFAIVTVAVGTGVTVSALGADSATGAIENLTPGTVKLLHTGGTTPNSQYADLGRLALPVGSWFVSATTTIRSQGAPTGVDCFLVAPNGQTNHQQIEITSAKNANIATLSFGTVTNAPNGGNADLFCKVSNPAAGRHVFADHTTLIGVSVSGVTSTRRRVARDLHDGLAQELAFVAAELADIPATLHPSLRWIRSAVARALFESRSAIAALSQPLDLPLTSAVAAEAGEISARDGVLLLLDLDESLEVDTGVGEAILRSFARPSQTPFATGERPLCASPFGKRISSARA